VRKAQKEVEMSGIDWEVVWRFVWPILRQGLIALLMALLTLLGYDQVIPSRFERNGGIDALKTDLEEYAEHRVAAARRKPKGA